MYMRLQTCQNEKTTRRESFVTWQLPVFTCFHEAARLLDALPGSQILDNDSICDRNQSDLLYRSKQPTAPCTIA